MEAYILVTLRTKMTMPDLQGFSWNLHLIKNVEDIVIFYFKGTYINRVWSSLYKEVHLELRLQSLYLFTVI